VERSPKSTFQKRFIVISAILGLLLLVVVFQYGVIMLSPSASPQSQAPTKTERGPILDRNGRILAVQTTVYSVVAWKPQVKDFDATAAALASQLELSANEIKERLTTAEGSIILKRRLSYPQAQDVSAAIDAAGLSGIYLEEETGRVYPNGTQLSHVLGFVGIDNKGLDGIEFSMDQELREGGGKGADGTIYGNQVMLTVDLDVQNELETLADQILKQHSPESVMLLALDASNGDVLAYASRPSYDPNSYAASKPEQRRNRAITFLYEPGSVFKIFSISGILNLGGINPNTTFNTSGGFRSTKFRDPITDLGDYGVLDPQGIIVHSSNVGAAYAADTVSQDSFYGVIKAFGFGERTGIELSGEERGLVKATPDWSGRTKPTMAIGQEIGVTPLQMATAATAIANEGTLLKPHLVKRIMSPSGQILHETQREPIRQVLRPDVAKRMLSYMHAAAEVGTGIRSNVKGVSISVKTGTAQIIDPRTGTYSKQAFIASCLGIFPTDAPKIIMYVVIVHPRGESTLGGIIAAPVIKDAAEFLIPHLGIERTGDHLVQQPSQVRISVPSLPALRDRVPDFRGLPLRTVVPLLSQQHYKFQINGSGWVATQDPAAGAPLTEGMTIRLTLQENWSSP